jgi:small subunit ribosomal protein S6
MIRQYETVFIITPVLSDDQVKEAVKKYTDFLVEKGAEMLNQEDWGMRKLAYPIQKKKTGFYHLLEFKVDSSVIAEYEVQFKRDERIMRFLTVRLDKDAIAYSERRRKKLAAKAEEKSTKA